MNFAEFLSSLTTGEGLALIGAALAVVLPGMGSAKAVGSVGESLNGLLSEDPSKFGKAFLLQALPATQGIYGFIVAFMVMMNIGILGGDRVTTIGGGLYYLFACLPIAFCGYHSAIRQGRVASAGIAMVSKRPEASGKAVTATAMVELYALLSLIASFLLVVSYPGNL